MEQESFGAQIIFSKKTGNFQKKRPEKMVKIYRKSLKQ